jgi:hypothetical protein
VYTTINGEFITGAPAGQTEYRQYSNPPILDNLKLLRCYSRQHDHLKFERGISAFRVRLGAMVSVRVMVSGDTREVCDKGNDQYKSKGLIVSLG